MIVVVEPDTDDYHAGVTSFLNSLTWLYLRHRYPVVAQGNLLRALTLSGLDSWWWERCTMHLAAIRRLDHGLLQVLMSAQEENAQDQLLQVVEEIWTYAAATEAPVGEPPLAPVYLMAHGYTAPAYLADLQQIYGRAADARYPVAWQETANLPQKPLIQPGFVLRQAVAVMGATAGAIERLMAIGASDGRHNS